MTPEKRLAEADKQLGIVQNDLDDTGEYLQWVNLQNARTAIENARDRLEGQP